MNLISGDAFREHFQPGVRAFHLELKDAYHVDSEAEPLRKWQAGEYDDHAWRRPWQGFLRERTDAGCVIQRVRVVTVPHSTYTRWLLAIAGDNVAAGEDIRYLPRHLAVDVDFPVEDCWLFDDDQLVLSVFPGDGRKGAFASETDPGLISRYRVARDLVWDRAIPHAEYVRSEYMQPV
ncbi:DUF6879 family protein [Nonomuraea sp. NPDC050547]|uniref:DUF6879 family protein n=1 Tax=Nonomuraea sp. NPDC050547 TaxID=3364368 RepID=UPI00379DC5C6